LLLKKTIHKQDYTLSTYKDILGTMLIDINYDINQHCCSVIFTPHKTHLFFPV